MMTNSSNESRLRVPLDEELKAFDELPVSVREALRDSVINISARAALDQWRTLGLKRLMFNISKQNIALVPIQTFAFYGELHPAAAPVDADTLERFKLWKTYLRHNVRTE